MEIPPSDSKLKTLIYLKESISGVTYEAENRNTVILSVYLRKLYLENMEEYIGTVIRVGGIAIGCVMVLFVIWYTVKDILDISGKDSSDGK